MFAARFWKELRKNGLGNPNATNLAKVAKLKGR
jgi:hypothetical protein